MPRVLIADDNSNVQKMVTLALKDAGIEVVAVGNGEAAVRKMPEITPDLVLADVFMPVRSGYEVCEFVKQDPRYMHTPVILLVGAFDPLDEREARRVQADGVLKKPFVPPDPLVNMVTTLLAKSAVLRQVAVTVPADHSPNSPTGKTGVAEPEESFEEMPDEPAELGNVPSTVTFADGDKPVAFSALLETPVAPTDQNDPIVTATRDPVLGEPAFWSAPPPAPEPTPEDLTDGHAWETPLPGNESSELFQPLEDSSLAESNQMEDEFAELGASLNDSVEEIAELPPLAEPEPVPESRAQSEPQPQAPPEPQSEALLEAKPETHPEPDIQARQDDQAASPAEGVHEEEAPAETAPATACALSADSPWPQLSDEAIPHAEEAAPQDAEAPAAPEISLVPDPAAEAPAIEETASEFAVPTAIRETPSATAEAAPILSPTESTAKGIVETASPFEEIPAELPAPAAPALAVPAAAAAATVPVTAGAAPKLPAQSPSQRWVELLSVCEDLPVAAEPWKPAKESFTWARNKQPELHAAAAKIPAEQPKPEMVAVPAAPAVELETSGNSSGRGLGNATSNAAPAIADPAPNTTPANSELMDAVVARVIERMQPKILEIVTHEILRPVVEALVRRELDKK